MTLALEDALKIVFDPDITTDIQAQIKQLIKDSVNDKCSCGCDEIYVSITGNNFIDVKCYNCGTSYFELEIEIEDREETIES